MLKQLLTKIMNDWPMPIDLGCRTDLESMIDQAATTYGPRYFAANPGKLAEAETNFKKLLEEMTWHAKTFGLSELHETTLAAARRRLCPIWPFC